MPKSRILVWVLVAAALLLITPTVHAQVPGESSGSWLAELAYGVKGGLNVANITENSESLDSRLGIVFGGFARHTLLDPFSIQLEGLFSQQGAKLQDMTLNTHYLLMPVLGLMSFPRDSWTPLLLAGPALGLNLTGNITYQGEKHDVDTSRGDLGLILGGAIEFPIISIEARYLFGLHDIDQGSDVVKSRVFSIMASYRLR